MEKNQSVFHTFRGFKDGGRTLDEDRGGGEPYGVDERFGLFQARHESISALCRVLTPQGAEEGPEFVAGLRPSTQQSAVRITPQLASPLLLLTCCLDGGLSAPCPSSDDGSPGRANRPHSRPDDSHPRLVHARRVAATQRRPRHVGVPTAASGTDGMIEA
ncbi:hypothetical protein GCM10010252_69520 [Streptomyces aureoverticillatus]|nr:hypothetical protein GCM10010252_69520 [Streptomyces aureoverticillatus]